MQKALDDWREAEESEYPTGFPRRSKPVTGMNENSDLLPRENALASFNEHKRYYDYENHFIVWFNQEKSITNYFLVATH